MSKNIRCDLAVEAKEMLCGSDTEISQLTGVSVNEKEVGGYIKITEVKILSDEGVKALGANSLCTRTRYDLSLENYYDIRSKIARRI